MPEKNRPNFLIIVPDMWHHRLLGCAGHPVVRTPNLDALAADGIRFDRCYTVQPMCMATRSTWFTGRTPRGHGVRCNGIPLDPGIPTMPDALRRAGYRTHSIGKLHLNPWMPHQDYAPDTLDPKAWPEAKCLWESGRITALPSPYYGIETAELLVGKNAGHYRSWLLDRNPDGLALLAESPSEFESVERTPDICWRSALPAEFHMTSWAAECAENFLEGTRHSEQPFFLWCSVPDPHPPYAVAEPYYGMYDPADMPEPIRRENELDDLPPHYRQLYRHGVFTAGRIAATHLDLDQERRVATVMCGMVTQFDVMVGRVMKKLRECGFAENTVVVFMGDHGQMLGEHWMRGMTPTHLDGNVRTPSIWSWPARFGCGVVEEALVSHLDFAPTILDLADVPIPEGTVPPRPECERQCPPWPGRSMTPLLTGTVDRIHNSVIVENDADYLCMRQRTLITDRHHITCYVGESYGELFDLHEDPHQLHNLWDRPEAQSLKRDLQVRLMERFAETDSTLPRRLGHA